MLLILANPVPVLCTANRSSYLLEAYLSAKPCRGLATQEFVHALTVPVKGSKVKARVVASLVREQGISTICDQVLHAIRVPETGQMRARCSTCSTPIHNAARVVTACHMCEFHCVG
jgi:hypothetical protein